jgi:SAM-dependent methyltransferase
MLHGPNHRGEGMGRDDARKNRRYWDEASEEYQALHASQLSTTEGVWGVWHLPESELAILGDVAGLDVLELGCGGAQWSIFLAGEGARPVALDNSLAQLRHARTLRDGAGQGFPLLQAAAERLPFGDERFDLVFCDHGAMSFADPRKTLPEVARVLRPEGRLAFNMSTPLLEVCWNEGTEQVDATLHRDYFRMRRFEDGNHVSYQLPYGAWIGLFRAYGFVVDDLVELRPPEEATTTYPDFVSLEWARRWPAEHVWKLTKMGA